MKKNTFYQYGTTIYYFYGLMILAPCFLFINSYLRADEALPWSWSNYVINAVIAEAIFFVIIRSFKKISMSMKGLTIFSKKSNSAEILWKDFESASLKKNILSYHLYLVTTDKHEVIIELRKKDFAIFLSKVPYGNQYNFIENALKE